MRRRAPRSIDITFTTFLRALAAVALAWMCWQLLQWALVFLVATFLAVALDPLVAGIERRGIRRAVGAPLLVLSLVLAVLAVSLLSAATIVQDAQDLGQRLATFRDTALARVPGLRQAFSSLTPSPQAVAAAGRALTAGAGALAVALVVTLYLLLDGRRTYRWLAAFASPASRPRVDATAAEARLVIVAFVRGNIVTSVLAGVFAWVVLAALNVPAALLLAVLAGVLDLIPVIGFFLSAAPAVLLGLSVSPTVALGVAAFYVLYNAVEGYYIQPKVFGRELRLSDLAVVAAFLVGAQLGGVLGAVVSLPLAAMYPIIEKTWLTRTAMETTADEHARVERQAEH
jgi:predicted PurR-regulated permease PerM